MRIAYLVIAHNNPQQVELLATTIINATPNSQIFIHYDAKVDINLISHLEAKHRITLIPNSTSVEWGDYSMMSAFFRSLDFIRNVYEFDWLILLSGQDFPIKPLAEFEAFLLSSDYDAFLEAKPMEDCQRPSHIYARYYYRYWKLPRFPYAYRIPSSIIELWHQLLDGFSEKGKWLNYMWMPRGLPGRLGIHTLRHPFRRKLQCYMGSQWLNLSRCAVDYLLNFTNSNPEVIEYYQHTIIPDEGLVQSILLSGGSLRICQNNLRFIIFENAGDAHPITLTSEHWEQMISADAYFARKFDIKVDDEVLKRLEDHIAPGFESDLRRSAL